jgi:hypothetical protein
MRSLRDDRWALVAAHPGHELRVHHWLERAQPLVAVLTDGSGSANVPRLHETTRLLERVGARASTVYGQLTDRQAYACLTASEAARFLHAAETLAREFEEHRIGAVVTDAAEGYNPVHDVSRAIAGTAVRLCRHGSPLLYEVDLVAHPDGHGDGIRLTLDDEAFKRKLAAVAEYAALAQEAQAAFDLHGVESFRMEFLRLADGMPLHDEGYVPYYEKVGDERVRQGKYSFVLRYGLHVRPVLASLQAVGRTRPSDALAFDSLH